MLGLDLGANYNYANPYETNWDYLIILTWLQKILLKEIEWDGEYIRDGFGLWVVPYVWLTIGNAKESVKFFINDLNDKLMEL